MVDNQDMITMDHGSGGIRTSELIDEILRPAFANQTLDSLGDGAVLPLNRMNGEQETDKGGTGALAFSTDSFVVHPYNFPGGNIGHLSVCGTVNDVAMCGAIPKWMSFSLILEEGFPVQALKEIVQSAAETAKKVGVTIVTGDTKVVERGHGDGIYINTAGIGMVVHPGLSPDRIRPGDHVLVTGPIGDHGAAVMLARNPELGITSPLISDCMPLNDLAETAWETAGDGLRVLRDATRGGVATTLNEFTEGRGFGIELEEAAVPVRQETQAICEILGLDPLYSANEGKMLAIVSEEKAEAVLAALRKVPGGEDSADIGTVSDRYPGHVTLKNDLGASRILTKLTGAQLPRIC